MILNVCWWFLEAGSLFQHPDNVSFPKWNIHFPCDVEDGDAAGSGIPVSPSSLTRWNPFLKQKLKCWSIQEGGSLKENRELVSALSTQMLMQKVGTPRKSGLPRWHPGLQLGDSSWHKIQTFDLESAVCRFAKKEWHYQEKNFIAHFIPSALLWLPSICHRDEDVVWNLFL